MALSSADVAGQLRLERQHLVKANQNIEEGRKRLVDENGWLIKSNGSLRS